MLAGDLGVAGVNGLAEIGTVARGAIGFVEQGLDLNSRFFGRFGGKLGTGHHAMRTVVSGQVSNVLIVQRLRNGAHRGVFAFAFFVFMQRRRDVARALARNHRHLVHLGERRLIALDAVAADTHGILGFSGLGVALDVLSKACNRQR